MCDGFEYGPPVRWMSNNSLTSGLMYPVTYAGAQIGYVCHCQSTGQHAGPGWYEAYTPAGLRADDDVYGTSLSAAMVLLDVATRPEVR